MSDTQQYISAYSGAQIEHAVTLYHNTKYAHRASFSHAIYKSDDSDPAHTPKWKSAVDEQTQQTYYYIDITLTGIYDQGDYPMVYFLDSNFNRYEVDYRNIGNDAAKDAPTIRVFSNVDIEGAIVEISNVSTCEYRQP